MASLLAASSAMAQEGERTNYAELERIARAAQTRAFAEKMRAIAVVHRMGRPARTVNPRTGQVTEVMRLSPSGRPIYFTTFNANAAKSTRASRVYAGGGAGLSLTGSGVKLGIWDGGTPLATHQDLTGRVTLQDAIDLGTHATHVAGTMIGAGVNASAKGMAFQATLDAYDWDDDTSEAALAAAAGVPIRLSNHSYGPIGGWAFDDENGDWYWMGDIADSTVQDSQFGMYDQYCVDWDDIAYNAPFYLPCFAVGNDRGEGPTSQPIGHYYYDGDEELFTDSVTRNVDGNGVGFDTICGMGAAKNVLSVGAVNDVLNYTGAASVGMSTFSGYGPTDDGRIKPDVMGNGVSVLSSIDTANNAYAPDNGTSMATPNVAGSTALLIQHFRNTHSGGNMRASMMRGLVIHTADEAGATTGPDYKFGWGLMDAEAAAKVITDDGINPDVMRDFTLTNGGTNTFYITSDGTAPLRFSICWTDPKGTVQSGLNNRTARLVHDLDLTVTKGAATYSPYCLSYSNPSAAATTGDNNVDNVEVIDVPAPSAGTYKITINHDGTLTANQAYSLIVTGAIVNPMMTSFAINGMYLTGRNSTNGTVNINNPAPVGGFKVYPRTVPAGIMNINSPIVIPEGATSRTFTIVGAGDVTTNTTYSVWVDAGYKSFGQAGTLIPLQIKTLTFPDTMAAGSSGTLTVGLNGPAPLGGMTLAVQRAPTYWINAAESMVIPQGQFSASIPISIKPGVPSTMTGQFRVVQQLLGGGTAQLNKPFTITP